MDRLELIASYTKGSKTVIDIGCDHAYALISSLKNYGVEAGIAADINEGPLNNAIKSIKLNNLENKIKAILSNGFDSIIDDFDTAIISGMGGILIKDILERGLSKISDKKLILEANKDADIVRRFLSNNNFKIVDETSIYENNKYYEIIVAEPGKVIYDEYDILYGPILRREKNEAFVNHYQDEIKLIENIIDKINDNNNKRQKLNKLFEIRYILDGVDSNKYYLKDGINYYRTYFIDDMPRPTIIITPGGGYAYTSPRESEPVVYEFTKRGYNVVVVNYREKITQYPEPGNNIKEVLELVSSDPRISNMIGMGFSAGGHAILELILHKDKYDLKANLDLLVLGYPVISSDPKIAHMGSFKNLLLDKENDDEIRNYLSLENEVNKDNVIDLFLWGTVTDESVVVENSLRLISAYKEVYGSVEYHLFNHGGHGLSVANSLVINPPMPDIARWIQYCDEWIKNKLK